MTNLPVKGTVWRHARRVDWRGEPVTLTVTSITNGKVYSVDKYRDRVKTPVDLFDKMCAEIVSVPDANTSVSAPRFTESECAVLFARAHRAGMDAGHGATPTPMTVIQRANPLDDSSPIVRQWGPVMDGVCGFASVIVRPGNSSFARYLKKVHGCSAAYYGGMEFWVHEFGQSYERKRAFAQAFAKVLSEAGIRAYADSRLD